MSTQAPRKAKYCPRCGTMTFPDTAVCVTCGHRFHTGVDAKPSGDVPKQNDDWANRTQMFEMPPSLSARPSRDTDIPAPLNPKPVRTFGGSKLMRVLVVAAVLLALAACITVIAHHFLGPF